MTISFKAIIAIAAFAFYSCQKAQPDNIITEPEKNVSNDATGSPKRLSYGDTVFFLKNQPGDYTVLPVSKPNKPGYFKANPIGLSIDSLTGLINISKSETGVRYKVYYLSTTEERLDSVKIVISGIDYKDAIYEINSTPNTYDTAFPIYNARPEIELPCGNVDLDDDGGLDDDDNLCEFDETDLNNDGSDDIAGVNQDKLLVDTKRGTIDVEASFRAGIFGSSEPANGVTQDFTFYYRLNDASNKALNKIKVRIYHFKKRSDIPQWLLDEISNRQYLSNDINARLVNNSTYFGARLGVTSKSNRPPIIIIVSQ
jgi:hypothetical protein